MVCPRCGSNNVAIYPVTKTHIKNRGCLGWLCWVILAACTCGLILIIPAMTNSKVKSKTKTEACCQHCGKRWHL